MQAFAPGFVLGLFIGRLLSELWAHANGSTSLLLALTVTLVTSLICAYLLRRIPFRQSWVTFLLLPYILYPESNLLVALAAAFLTLLVGWQISGPRADRFRGQPFVLGAIVLMALVFFALYVLTLAPDLLPADNGEFQVVATNLGIAHPPGFPLYTVIAHMMTRLPIGATPAYRVNLLSALTSTLTLAAVYGALFLLTRRHLAALIGVVALGTATTFWAQATTANIRSLSAFFAALMLLTLLGFYRAMQTARSEQDRRLVNRYLILWALIAGLGVAHHASLAFMALIALFFILITDPSLARTPRRWWLPLLALLIGLLPLLYLPLRAASGARGASPELATWSGFLEHVLALGFRGDLFVYLQPMLLWERIKIMGNVLTFQFDPLLLLGMLLGLLLLLLRDWRVALLLGGSFALHTFVTATYRAPQTVEYMLPAYIPLAILLGAALGAPPSSWDRWQVKGVHLPIREILAAILLLVGLRQLVINFPSYSGLHQDSTARDYAQTLLEKAPPGSVILADWHWVTPLWYLQEVEGRRTDVSVRFVFPAGEPYGQTWARRIGEELAQGNDVVSTHFDPAAFTVLPYPEPLNEAFLFRQEPLLELPEGYTPVDVILGDRIHLVGYQVARDNVQAGEEATVNLAWQPIAELDAATTIFTHLANADGLVYAQQDLPALGQTKGITVTQFRLTPRLDALPGEYVVLAGAYDSEPLVDSSGQERALLTEIPVTARSHPYATFNPLQRSIPSEGGRQLVGYDWDNSLPGQQRLYLHWREDGDYQTEIRDNDAGSLPPFAGPWGVLNDRWVRVTRPGSGFYVPFGQGIIWYGDQLEASQSVDPDQTVRLYQDFLSSRPVMRDYAISVRLIGYEEDGYHWDWWDLDDGIPAMGAIPTLKWIGGSRVRSPHFVSVDKDAPAGQQIGAALNLYDAFTSRVLPILDERINVDYAWLPLGATHISE